MVNVNTPPRQTGVTGGGVTGLAEFVITVTLTPVEVFEQDPFTNLTV
jgi:hypothetical protein